MAQLNNSTLFSSPGNTNPFTVTIPAVQAGAKLVCVTYGGAILQADINGSNFTKRDRSLGNMEVVCQDIVAGGGETTVTCTLNGPENINGAIFEFAAGSLGAFVDDSTNTADPDIQFQADAGSVVTAGPAVIFSAFAAIDPITAPTRRWWGLEPLGKVVVNTYSTGLGSQFSWGQIGVSDVVSAGTYGVYSSRWPGNQYQSGAWAYADTSGIPTYSNIYPNAIAAENSLPGSSTATWYGAPQNANISGYTDKMSYNPGETVNFKVNSNNVGFNVEINRVGYYGYVLFGAKRKAVVAGIPAVQPAATTNGYGGATCAWSTTATWAIPSDITPGVYIANVRRTDNGNFVSPIIFVVKSPVPTAKADKIMLKTADFTWQAYNLWGAFGDSEGTGYTGRSIYGQGPAGISNSSLRAYATSYDRPLGIPSNSASTTFEDSEVSMIGFLEGNGYDLAYFSCVDVEKDPTIPSKFKIAMMSGHDEYWTLNMRDAYSNARDQGTNLVFSASNVSLWRVRFAPGDTEKRTMICYKDSLDTTGFDNVTKYDPVQYTGTWRDSRTNVGGVNNPLRRPESELEGQWFIANAGTYPAMVVSDTYKNMPIWRNTTVAALGPGGSETLFPGSIGYEFEYVKTDEPTTPKNLVLVQDQSINLVNQMANDNGDSYSGSGAVKFGMSLYYAPSGALVFCTGTWRWAWGINRLRDNLADVNGIVNTTMQQATINIIGDMGIAPAQLMSTVSNNNVTPLIAPGEPFTPERYGISVPKWGTPIS